MRFFCTADMDQFSRLHNAGVDVLELVRSIRRFAAQFTYDLPGQQFIERVGAAREVWGACNLSAVFERIEPCLSLYFESHVRLAWDLQAP